MDAIDYTDGDDPRGPGDGDVYGYPPEQHDPLKGKWVGVDLPKVEVKIDDSFRLDTNRRTTWNIEISDYDARFDEDLEKED